jgi:hypothetical protein
MAFPSINSIPEIINKATGIGDTLGNIWNDGAEFVKNLSLEGKHRIQEPTIISYPSGMDVENDNHTWISIITTKTGVLKKNLDMNVNEMNGSSTEQILYGLALPFPQSVQLSDSYNWSGEELGIADVLLKGSWSEGLASAESQAGALLKQKTSQMVGNLTGLNVGAAENIRNQHVRNMNIHAMFKDVQLRQFALSFDFAPTSEQEVKNTIKIIREVRAHAAPENEGGYFTYPGYFDVKVQSGDNVLVDYGKCAATSVAVNYTPDGIWATFRSGFPVHVTMDIAFMETTVATASLIRAGKK